MSRAVIVFHSVCGNTFLVAEAFEKALAAAGHEVVLRRVRDTDWLEPQDISDGARGILRRMRTLAEAEPQDLAGADIVLMGSPVYFGNVSAELKAFMDSTGGLWFQGKLWGKKFAAFVSAGNSEGGGDLALQALHTYAFYMGMSVVPLPNRIVPAANVNALGLIHCSNGQPLTGLDAKTSMIVDQWSRMI
jgi:NAD(P)H dehydrogenase (quinone)